MRRFGCTPGRLLFATVLLGPWCAKHVEAEPPPAAPSSFAQTTWAGTVIDARSGDPIAGATVTAYDARAPHRGQATEYPDAPRAPSGEAVGEPATTDTGGRFRLSAAGARSLAFTSPGYLDGVVDLPAGRYPDLGTMTMEPATLLRGRIVGVSGPLSDVAVGLVHSYDEVAPEHLARTNEHGFFVLDGVALKRSTMRLFAVEGFGVLFEFKQLPRRAFDLGEVRVPARRRVVGSVLDASGAPIPGARVALESPLRGAATLAESHSLTRMIGPTREDGTFEVLAPEGGYSLWVQAPGGTPEWMGRREVAGVSEVDLGALELPPPVEIYGSAVDEDGVPLADVLVELATASIMRGWHDGEFPVPSTTTDTTGAWTLPVPSTLESGLLNFRRPGHVPVDESLTPRSPLGAQRRVDTAERDHGAVILPREDTTIFGRVIDERGDAVASMQIHAERAFENPGFTVGIGAQTDEDGRFRLSALHAGEWSLSTGGGEYDRVTRRGIELGSGEAMEVTLRLRRLVSPGGGRPIDVRVIDFAGRPAIGVRVHLDEQGKWGRAPSYRAQRLSGADGRVRFDDVPDGIFQVWGTHPSRGSLEAMEVRIEPGVRTIVVGFRPPRHPPTRLEGRVVDAEGRPVTGASVTATVSREPPRQTGITQFQHATTDASGAFEFPDMPAARYRLSAWRRGFATTRLAGELDVTPAGLGNVEITLEPGAAVHATIRGLSTEELRDAHVQVVRDPEDETGPARRVADAVFRVDNVGRGAWSVTVRTREGRVVSTPIEVAVGVDEVSAEVEFVSGFTLSGQIRFRGTPAPAFISLGGRERIEGRSRHLNAGDDGVYEVRDLHPDVYRLFIRAGPMRSPFVQEVRVDGDTVQDVDIRGGVLIGQLVDAATGEGIGGGRLRISPVEDNLGADTFPGSPDLSADGRFRVGPLAGVPWRLEANAPGYSTEIVTVPLDDADVDDIEIQLARTPGLALTVGSAFGDVLDSRNFYWQSLDGSRVYRRSLYSNLVQELHWENIPLGEGVLTVVARNLDLVKRMRIDNRGERVDVVLEPAGFLDLAVEGLEADANARVEILDEHGLGQFAWGRGAISSAPWMRLREGRGYSGLAAGRYTVVVTAGDGRRWRQEVEIRARELTEIVLR